MNRISVALFSNRAQAEALQARLLSAGIQAEAHDEQYLEKLWHVSKAASGVRLEVPADQFERTEQLLLEWDAAEGALREAIRCPECRSLRVQYPQFTRKAMIPNLLTGLLATIGALEKQYYCEDCHFTWPKGKTMPGSERAHAGTLH
jgi:predicted Zn-ribbon and HTH transcriptional regulator